MDENTIHLGAGGITMNGNGGGMLLDGGYLTSLTGVIPLRYNGSGHIEISSQIRDNGSIKVGLSMEGGGVTYFLGKRSNIFSGNIAISGRHTLVLSKNNAISISGNMNIKEESKVIIHNSGQIGSHVEVSLESQGELILRGVQEQFRKLEVNNGVLDFATGYSRLILDDLEVASFGQLTVRNWSNLGDLILVRKTSTHIKNSLSRIIFQGQRGRVHLEDYNKDYWELTTAPEPATTGAVLAALGLTITVCRKRHSPQLTC